MNKTLYLLPFVWLISSCALAPFSSNHSARTLGKKHFAAQGGVSVTGQVPYGRIGYGFTDNFDAGLLAEVNTGVTAGIWGKYGFINNPEGFSFSVEGSVGGGADGMTESSYFYVAPTIGTKIKWWEPYASLRYSYVHYEYDHTIHLNLWGGTDVPFQDEGYYHYGTITVGNTLWATSWLGLNINANYLVGNANGLYVGAGIVLMF